MYSLQKYYEDEGKKNPLQGEKNICYSIKLDGAAISILYINGELTRVLTRGDGKEGTDITNKFIGSCLIPQKLHHDGILQISGEIVAPNHIPNARNYAAGALNLKDASDFKGRALTFFAYNMQPYFNETFEEDMGMLQRMGFHTVMETEIDKVYPTDGLVYRINSNSRCEELGFATNWPLFAYARKERGDSVETTLLGVEWSTSKSGRVNPVAILEPVYIGDKLVSRATLNNPGFIEALDIQIGDRIALIMGGEIIPKITHKVE